MATSVLIDCDPGTDDAIALAAAVVAPELSVEAITTVAGNQTLEKTTENAVRLLSLCDRPDIPVAAGMDRPLVRPLKPAPEIHGESGLADLALPVADQELEETHAVDRIYETARTSEGLTILAIGPLTNVATALRRYPDLADRIDGIVVMGGSITGGNVTAAAEFNVHTDPEAAHIVFAAPTHVTMVGLDVTRAARIGATGSEQIRTIGSDVTDAIAGLIDHLQALHQDRYGWTTAPVHDALAAVALMDRDVLTTEPMRVDVELRGQYTTGTTVCDRLGASDRPPNVDVATAVDAKRFRSQLLRCLNRYA